MYVYIERERDVFIYIYIYIYNIHLSSNGLGKQGSLSPISSSN